MLKGFKIYQHEFFANLYLNPSTMDAYVEPPENVHRLDFLLLKDAIRLGKLESLGFKPVEVTYAILTEPNRRTVAFRRPYTARIREGDDLKRIRTRKEAAKALIPLLQELIEKPDDILLNGFMDYFSKFRDK